MLELSSLTSLLLFSDPSSIPALQEDDQRTIASRRDSWGLPGVPRGKDGAEREKVEINFIWNLEELISTPAIPGNTSTPQREIPARGRGIGDRSWGAEIFQRPLASVCVSQRGEEEGKAGKVYSVWARSLDWSTLNSGVNCGKSPVAGKKFTNVYHRNRSSFCSCIIIFSYIVDIRGQSPALRWTDKHTQCCV